MAQPSNTFDSYDAKGIREDLENVIYDISPEETPFYSSLKKVKASNTYHEWQTDAGGPRRGWQSRRGSALPGVRPALGIQGRWPSSAVMAASRRAGASTRRAARESPRR